MVVKQDKIGIAAEKIGSAEAIFVTAGAGIGVDSGLPDFRGDEGFWKAYPPLAQLGLSFVEMANPRWFEEDPELAWGFYGHRLDLYRTTIPHPGFELIRRWVESKPGGSFVFTSNVDGQFQKAGFPGDCILECHGSLLHLQCSRPCSNRIWSSGGVDIEVDKSTFRANGDLPVCPDCHAVARPNVLLFGDGGWVPNRADEQENRLRSWFESVRELRLVVIEIGAGTAVPTVRWQSEEVQNLAGAPLVRINPRDFQGPPGTLSLAGGALEVLESIEREPSRPEDEAE